MSDFDYGKEKGFWGKDGIPYWINDREKSYSRTKKRKSTSSKSFNKSEQLAIDNGFDVVIDEGAYNGRCFIKNGKIWIHNITGLKKQLGIYNNVELCQLGYDVDAYFAVNY